MTLASQQCTQMPQNSPERPFLPICVHSCVAAHEEASRGRFDGVLARKARSGPGNARTGGEAETLRWVSDDLFLEAGDRPGLGQLEHASCVVALRDVPAKEGRAAGLPLRGPAHAQARFAPADGARSSRACY